MYLDGAAVVAGLLAAGVFCRIVWRRLSRGERQTNPAYVFSLTYLTGLIVVTVVITGGQVFSLNRHLFATAFWMVAGTVTLRNSRFSWRALTGLFVLAYVVFILFDWTDHRVFASAAGAAFLSSWLFVCHGNTRVARSAAYLLYAINVAVQTHLLDRFMSGAWVG